ncbi:MAG: helix-turn-helix domain-containing protein [Novosphingobium sp.]|nr:helix-turn-helix domain-containing protein [Novosphingobium sp.]
MPRCPAATVHGRLFDQSNLWCHRLEKRESARRGRIGCRFPGGRKCNINPLTKAAGVYRGRKPSVDVNAVRALCDQGVGGTEIASRLGIGRASVYRALSG